MPKRNPVKILTSKFPNLSGLFARLKDLRNWLPNSKYRLNNWQNQGLPIPPPYLIFKVAGTSNLEWFIRSGTLAAQNLRDVLSSNGIQIQEFQNMLDFGCGVGRVIRHWKDLEGIQIFGTDINPDLIHWCWANLPFAQFQVNSLEGKLGFEDQSIDFVYALSVFTHLDVKLQHDWMGEIFRILKPGGYLILTTHGDHYLPRLAPADRQTYLSGEMVILGGSQQGSNFCNAYHPYAYVINKLANAYTCLDFIPKGAAGNPQQDIYLFQKMHLKEVDGSADEKDG